MLNKTSQKLGLYFTLAFSSITLFNPVFAEQIEMEATVTSDVLTIRQEPKSDAPIVTSLKKGTKVPVTGSDDKREWYQVTVQNKKGWASGKFIQLNINGNLNLNTVSTIGSTREQGILQNPLKITSGNKYKYVLDSSDKFRLNAYDTNNNFISSRELTYPWVHSKADESFIVIAVDEDENLLTNSISRNTITKFDPAGLKTGEIKSEGLGDVSNIEYDRDEKLLYSLDNSQKTIKVFDGKGLNTRNIFLSETRTVKDFSVSNGKVYVLDYPENINDYTPVYYVNSYSFALRNNYDPKAAVVENLSKGSILKYDPAAKIIKSKILIDDDPAQVKETSWLDFSENGKKQYGNADEIKKVNVLGEIDIYKSTGEPVNTISLNKKWVLNSPDRHKAFNDNEINRKMIGVIADKDGTVIVPVLSKIKNGSTSSLNYYYLNPGISTYKVSQPLPFQDSSQLPALFSEKNIYTLNGRGYISVINENGIEKASIGRINPEKFNLPEKIFLANNKLYAYDRGNYSFGEYDLNGEAIKVRRIEQGSDLFRWSDVFYSNNAIIMAKTLDVEEKKMGLEIYNLNFKKLFDQWVMTLNANTVPRVARNENNEIFIAGKGSYYGKKSFLTMLNDKGHMINHWAEETDLIGLFPEENHRNIKSNSIRVIGFDQQANIYVYNALATNRSRVSKIKINSEGRGEIIKNFDGNFFLEARIPTNPGKEIKEIKEISEPVLLNNIFTGEIVDIKTGKNGFTYFLLKDKNKNSVRLGLFDPSGSFWKDFTFEGYGAVHGFNLDNQDNVWITEGSGIKKLATYQ